MPFGVVVIGATPLGSATLKDVSVNTLLFTATPLASVKVADILV